MGLRPIDIRRKEFRNGFRGYDAGEVDDFLDAVSDDYEQVYAENIRMREELSVVRERLAQFEELEGSIQAALVHAEKAAEDLRKGASREADNLRANANREAELIIREAKARSHQMLADSSARVERVRESYEALREAKESFAADFRRLLKGYMEVMDNAEVLSAREIENSLRERLDLESVAVAREAAGNASSETEDPEATQRIDWRSIEGDSPETEEPEVEPSSAEHESSRGSVVTDPGAAEEVDREEPAPEEPPNGDADAEDKPPSRAGRSVRRRE